MQVAGSDPTEFYAWCEEHHWTSPDTTSDPEEAARWAENHRTAEPVLA